MSDNGAEDDHGHGDKPWVFFAVDCFFLITQFFVITFKVKSDELALPQRLPAGGIKQCLTPAMDPKKKLSVHVSRVNGAANYEFMSKSVNLQGLNDMLAGSVGGGQEYQVRVSYAPEVPFGDVLAVFDSCAKVKIAECGLIPLRGNN
ncbi:MAG TPA: biopolymer transporter ExbD [Planctomycetota bacterium]|nr:biopolymer transporter ExbD [Planctomycetota bacterium]